MTWGNLDLLFSKYDHFGIFQSGLKNQLECEIPMSVRDLCNLRILYLSDNNLTGLLEEDFLAFSNNTLEVLDLSHKSILSRWVQLEPVNRLI